MSSILFFSGGSAIAPLARYFTRKSVPTAHLITTFDNGGSTAELRKAFAMPAIGDLRNRLLALASPEGPSALVRLLKLRLSPTQPLAKLENQLRSIISETNYNWSEIPEETAFVLREALTSFLRNKPKDFKLGNASVGNLVITGLFLENGGHLEDAVSRLGQLLHICGFVRPITEASLQLAAKLSSKDIVIGQDHFKHLPAPVEEIFLTVHEASRKPVKKEIEHCHVPLGNRSLDLINQASLICYPPGSFYSSLLVNFLVAGVGKAVARTKVAKVMIPNTGHDPEAGGLTLSAQVKMLLKILARDVDAPVSSLLNYVIIDSVNGRYNGDLQKEIHSLQAAGINVLDVHLVSAEQPGAHLPMQTAKILLELASKCRP